MSVKTRATLEDLYKAEAEPAVPGWRMAVDTLLA
jgi:hypothetical protein